MSCERAFVIAPQGEKMKASFFARIALAAMTTVARAGRDLRPALGNPPCRRLRGINIMPCAASALAETLNEHIDENAGSSGDC